MSEQIKTVFYFGIAAIALVALAEYLPNAAIMFTIILVVGVILNNYQFYSSYLIPPHGKKI